jgi:hypothetical protein
MSAEDEPPSKRENFYTNLAAIVTTICVLALLALAGHQIYTSIERGNDRREAENQTKIEREITMQEALRAYREDR